MVSCSSTERLIRAGKYEKAFRKSLKKVIRNPKNENAVKTLSIAYNKSQEKSLGIINNMISSGNPDIWDNVYVEYIKMNERLEKISPLLPLKYNGKELKVIKDDFFGLASEAKKKAAEYHYVLGKKMLSSNDKDNCREAFKEFDKVLSYYKNYKNAKDLKEKAYECGISYVAIYYEDRYSELKLITEDKKILFAFDENDFNSFWVKYEAYINEPVPDADYYIAVSIDKIIMHPERVENNTYKVEKVIMDGEEYVRDENGNILTDTTGNPVTKPVYREVFCIVKETMLMKDAEISAIVRIIDGVTGKVIKKDMLHADQHFRYEFAQANGDLRVLDDRQRKLISHKPKGFPHDEVFVTELLKNLSRILYEYIKDNRRHLK